MNARTILELLQSLTMGATAFMLSIPQASPSSKSLGKKHTSSQTPKTLPPNKNAKSNSHLLRPKLTWAGDVIQDFSFSRVCSTTVQSRTINTTLSTGIWKESGYKGCIVTMMAF